MAKKKKAAKKSTAKKTMNKKTAKKGAAKKAAPHKTAKKPAKKTATKAKATRTTAKRGTASTKRMKPDLKAIGSGLVGATVGGIAGAALSDRMSHAKDSENGAKASTEE